MRLLFVFFYIIFIYIYYSLCCVFLFDLFFVIFGFRGGLAFGKPRLAAHRPPPPDDSAHSFVNQITAPARLWLIIRKIIATDPIVHQAIVLRAVFLCQNGWWIHRQVLASNRIGTVRKHFPFAFDVTKRRDRPSQRLYWLSSFRYIKPIIKEAFKYHLYRYKTRKDLASTITLSVEILRTLQIFISHFYDIVNTRPYIV